MFGITSDHVFSVYIKLKDKYSFKVHAAFIGRVHEKLGIHQHENYRESCSDNPRNRCVKHFGFM